LLHLPIAILLALLARIGLTIALHVPIALWIRGTIPIATLAARPLARLLILIAALSGALVLVLLFVASLFRPDLRVLVLLVSLKLPPMMLATKTRDGDRQQTLSQVSE
jgi:hypothetical protein